MSPELVPFVDVLLGKQVRSDGLDFDHVANLRAAADDLPAIVVHRQTMRIIDGHHRREVWKQTGRATIPVKWYEGDDPAGEAVRLNTEHGLPLTLKDRKSYARTVLTDYPDLSDREVGRRAGLSPTTVGQLRPCATVQNGQSHTPPSRIGADQRPRPVDPAPARERVAEIARANPDLSTRKLADEAGVSHHAARDTKARLARGEDPVPPKLQAVPKPQDGGVRVDEVIHYTPDWRGGDEFRADATVRDFGLWMYRKTGGVLDFDMFTQGADLDACPEVHRRDAADELRRIARFYERAAVQISSADRRLRSV